MKTAIDWRLRRGSIMKWLRRRYSQIKRRWRQPKPPLPPKSIQPSILTRLRWRLFGSPSAEPKPPKATHPSAFTRLRWRLFGSPSAEPKPPRAVQTFFLWRIVRAILFRLRIHLLFESNGEGIHPRYWRTRDWRR